MTKIKTCLWWRRLRTIRRGNSQGCLGCRGVGAHIILSVHVQCECLETRSSRSWCLPGSEAEDPRSWPFPSSWSWHVQELCHPRSNCKLIFSFPENSYFWNTVIVKEFYHDITGMMWLPFTVAEWEGNGCSSCVTFPIPFALIQDIEHIFPLHSAGSGIMDWGFQHSVCTPAALVPPLVVKPQLPRISQDCRGVVTLGLAKNWGWMLEFLVYTWVGLGPHQACSDFIHVASRSSPKIKSLQYYPWKEGPAMRGTYKNTCFEGNRRGALKSQLCRVWDMLLSQIRKLGSCRMAAEPGFRSWSWMVTGWVGDLGDFMGPNLTQSSCSYSMTVLGDTAAGRMI